MRLASVILRFVLPRFFPRQARFLLSIVMRVALKKFLR